MQTIKTIIRTLFDYPSVRISDKVPAIQQDIDEAANYVQMQHEQRDFYRRLSDAPTQLDQLRW